MFERDMQASPLLHRTHHNLKAFRRASALASDVCWITRHLPSFAPPTLGEDLRRAARAIPAAIARGWGSRHDAAVFIRQRDRAWQACVRLRFWLSAAFEHGCLTEEQYQVLERRTEEISRLLRRLRTEPVEA